MAENEIPTDKPKKDQFTIAPSVVVVNTGHGKGKSSAAFGVVLRSLALDWPVAVVQFLKSGDWQVGEEKMCRQLGVEWFAAGDGFTWDSDDLDESRAMAVAAWAFAKELIGRGEHRLIVLDEISYAMTWGWIDPADVAAAVAGRPVKTNMVITGRDMAQEVIDVADTVTEMKVIKHAFDRGIVAKKGIDY
ncbi:MAG: cob(I)yrinic acid a,c-diamide adenosyltransferase [Acidimicrobiales bacterium]|nr:cob(I)yrinic acid a,c-diamide adenosyltransferase [Acidimicrobiales bacterium]